MLEEATKLTENQRKFCDEWLIHGNGVLAYQTAYPNVKTYTTAASQASYLLKKPHIQNYLDAKRAEIKEKMEITPEKLMALQVERATFSPKQLLDPKTGHIIPLHRLPDHVARNITKMKIRQAKPKVHITDIGEEVLMEQQTIEIDWDNGQAARESLMKVFGLYEQDNKQKTQNIAIYNEVRAQIEKEMVNETLEEIEEQNLDLGELDEPNLMK